jgi:hypothetical protein
MALSLLASGQRFFRSATDRRASRVIRRRRSGYQVIVYAGIDPVTGRQRKVSRQAKGKREAERLEGKLRAEVMRAGTAARQPVRWPSCWTPG